jgi:mannose-6-phosphate isomerase-like protein (cupin superfamily)
MEDADVRVFKQGHSLRSIQRGTTCIRVIYESDTIEVLTIELGPRSSVDESYLWYNTSFHMIVEGNLAFEVGERSYELLRGEGISIFDNERYRIHNLVDTKGVIFCFLFNTTRGSHGSELAKGEVQ